MRREGVVGVLLLAVAVLVVSPSASAQSRKKPFSGCEKGAYLGKVLITVERVDGTCRVTAVTPASVCVAPNGAIRWQVEVEPECEILDGTELDPAIEITEPRYKRLDPEEDPERAPILEDCGRRFKNVKAAGPNILFCDIAENAGEGFYKYNLRGRIHGVDPGVEVRGPRAP